MIQWEKKNPNTLFLILGAPGKLSLQLQGWETLGYSSFALVLVSLSHTEAQVHVHTHLSLAHLVFSPPQKFLWPLIFIQTHPFPGRQAVSFPCTFNSKYTHVFPTDEHSLLPFPHVQGGIETVQKHHRHHTHPFMAIFSLSSTMPASAEDTLLILFQPAGQGYGGQKDENPSFLSPLTGRTCQKRLGVP